MAGLSDSKLQQLSDWLAEVENAKAAVKLGHQASHFEIGLARYLGWGEDQDFRKALSELRLALQTRAAPLAHYWIGDAYWNGNGVAQSDAEAIRHFKLSAEGNDPEAHGALAKAYELGRGVRKDPVEATRHREIAARLTATYETNTTPYRRARAASAGEGASRDDGEAFRQFLIAAEIDDDPGFQRLAQMEVGLAYWAGEIVERNDEQAIRYFERAAKNGLCVPAYQMIGLAHLDGRGVERDDKKALHFYRMAARGGSEEAALGLAKAQRIFELRGAAQGRRDPAIRRYVPAGIFALVTALLAAEHARLSASQNIAAFAALAAIGCWVAFDLAKSSGVRSQADIAQRFAAASKEPQAVARIGGVKWVFVDGSFRRLDHDGGGRGVLYRASSDSNSRHTQELTAQKNRREFALTCMAFTAAFGLAYAVQHAGWMMATAAISLGGSLTCITLEALYRHGVQWIPGAMVLDTTTGSLGRAEVEEQRVHGDARLATPSETMAAARGRSSGPNVQKQEF